MDVVEVKAIEVEPNHCPLEAKLHLKLSFVALQLMKDAQWHVKVGENACNSQKKLTNYLLLAHPHSQYIVDFTNKRQEVPVGASEVIAEYGTEQLHTFTFDTPEINVSAISPVLLNNAGLLVLTLTTGEKQQEIFQLSMLVRIERVKNAQTGETTFTRTILSPLE